MRWCSASSDTPRRLTGNALAFTALSSGLSQPRRRTHSLPSPMPITIKVNTNGPLFITAADAAQIHLTDAEGKNVTLCRCGASQRKPFCDGGHKSSGFDGTCAPVTVTPA
jgi:CDGSH-type Zn-finger protein